MSRVGSERAALNSVDWRRDAAATQEASIDVAEVAAFLGQPGDVSFRFVGGAAAVVGDAFVRGEEDGPIRFASAR